MIPLVAKNSDQLAKFIKWVSTIVQKAASAPPSKPANSAGQGSVLGGNYNIPLPDTTTVDDEVW